MGGGLRRPAHKRYFEGGRICPQPSQALFLERCHVYAPPVYQRQGASAFFFYFNFFSLHQIVGGVHAPPVYQSPAARAFPLSPPLLFFFIICVLTPCNIVCVLLFFLCDRPWRQPTWRQGGGRVFPYFVYSCFLLFFSFSPLPPALASANVEARCFRTLSIHFFFSFFPSSTTGTGGSDRVPHTVYFRHGLWRLCPFAGIFFLFFVPFLFFFPLGHLQAQRGLYLQHKKQYRNGSKQD